MKNLFALMALLLAGGAQASSGLQDLKEALARFKNQQPVKAQLSFQSRSEGGDESGSAQVQLPIEDGPQGLRLSYPQPLLARAEQEDAAKDRDPKVQTPTSTGLREVGMAELRDMLRAAEVLQRRLGRANFKAETPDSWQGQPARKLSFALENTRPNKYVKEYSGLLEVWINEQGVPLASRAQQKFSGRAYVLISFDMSNEDENHYHVQGDRLLTVKRQSRNSGSGGGEKGSNSRQLQLLL